MTVGKGGRGGGVGKACMINLRGGRRAYGSGTAARRAVEQ